MDAVKELTYSSVSMVTLESLDTLATCLITGTTCESEGGARHVSRSFPLLSNKKHDQDDRTP